MRIALATTTVHTPHVLRLLRAIGPGIDFFVAFDEKTPFLEAGHTCAEVGAQFFAPDTDDKNWRCSQLIGRNCIQRRNIAILEALKWGADAVVTWDTDNIPLNSNYFYEFGDVLKRPFHGPMVGLGGAWFDPGQWLVPPARQRGFPVSQMSHDVVSVAVGVKVGVAQGVCIGDPDISAVERLSIAPIVHQASELLRNGVVVDPTALTVFNSQNTVFLRELAPCFLMVPQFGRSDDIMASLIARRVMRERGMCFHIGRPFCWQQRNPHNLVADLKAEMWGTEYVTAFASWLDRFEFKSISPLGMVRELFEDIASAAWCPAGVSELGLAWCNDIESVL